MTKMIIPIGNIGCGKSLMAEKYAKKGFSIINMDTIQSMFSGGVYGAYDYSKKDIYLKTETVAIESSLENGTPVYIDRTNMDKKRRERFIDIAKKYHSEVTAIDYGCGDDKSLKRRLLNPRGTSKSTWRKVHESMRGAYDKPEISEGFSSVIEPPKKFNFYAFDFDGTIVSNKFPEIGDIISGTVDKMNGIYNEVKNIIIIWSCRSGDHENEMREFLLKNKIPFDFINENPVFDTGGNKIFAHEYYDDRNKI